MKYALIIPDGAADQPLAELGHKTPLQIARTPHMDAIAAMGIVGTAATVPDGFESGSDVATMSLLGYDPAVYHTGRAPLEAAAKGIALGPDDTIFRCNLVTVIDGVMKDHSAGGISDADAAVLIRDLARAVQVPGVEFFTGVSYRNLMAVRDGGDFSKVKTIPPHEIPNEPVADHVPSGPHSELLRSIMTQSKRMFDAHHEVTKRRGDANPATQAWLWGQGKASTLPNFAERFGVARGCMITGVDLLRGLAKLIGWDVHEVPGMTSFHDTDYGRQGVESAAMLDDYDFVFSHVESPDEASHQADVKTKIAAIEAIDQHVVGPVLAKLKTFPEWRICVMPDHPTLISTRKHARGPTPFAIAGTGLAASGKSFSEADAIAGERIDRGHDFMAKFVGR